jgi:hypothetical protein
MDISPILGSRLGSDISLTRVINFRVRPLPRETARIARAAARQASSSTTSVKISS